MANGLFLFDEIGKECKRGWDEVLAVTMDLKQNQGSAELKKRVSSLAYAQQHKEALVIAARIIDHNDGDVALLQPYRMTEHLPVFNLSYLGARMAWHDFLNPEWLCEVSLISTHGSFYGEHALVFIYENLQGAVACIDGMRYPTREILVATGEAESFAPRELLARYIFTPLTIRRGTVVRGVPIDVPPGMGWKEIRSKVAAYLSRNVPIEDGFIRWMNDDVVNIFGLMKKGWHLQ